MLITFNTDSSLTYRGFKVIYPPGLDAVELSGPTGEIASPDYPMEYPNSALREWKIAGPEDSNIELNLQDLRLEECSLCECDVLEIFEGESGPPVERLCGYRVRPLIYTSESNVLRLRFSSDGNVADSGFRATYRIIEAMEV